MTKNVSLQTDKNGHVGFRGFFGNYSIDVTKADGTKKSFTIHVGKNESDKWTFQIE